MANDEFTFYIQPGYCFVTVVGIGRVQIKKEDEGIVVDIFPLVETDAFNESVASTYAFTNELLPPEE